MLKKGNDRTRRYSSPLAIGMRSIPGLAVFVAVIALMATVCLPQEGRAGF